MSIMIGKREDDDDNSKKEGFSMFISDEYDSDYDDDCSIIGVHDENNKKEKE